LVGKEVLEIYGLAVTTDIEEPNYTLSHTQAVILFRIARELLINITKHAEVDDAELSLRFDGEQVLLRVSDHGRGIANQEQALSGVSGFGLNSVRERITFLGGSMSLLSGPQQGLTVTVKLPVEQKGEKHDH
jgi:signal transduction histidine kinase